MKARNRKKKKKAKITNKMSQNCPIETNNETLQKNECKIDEESPKKIEETIEDTNIKSEEESNKISERNDIEVRTEGEMSEGMCGVDENKGGNEGNSGENEGENKDKLEVIKEKERRNEGDVCGIDNEGDVDLVENVVEKKGSIVVQGNDKRESVEGNMNKVKDDGEINDVIKQGDDKNTENEKEDKNESENGVVNSSENNESVNEKIGENNNEVNKEKENDEGNDTNNKENNNDDNNNSNTNYNNNDNNNDENKEETNSNKEDSAKEKTEQEKEGKKSEEKEDKASEKAEKTYENTLKENAKQNASENPPPQKRKRQYKPRKPREPKSKSSKKSQKKTPKNRRRKKKSEENSESEFSNNFDGSNSDNSFYHSDARDEIDSDNSTGAKSDFFNSLQMLNHLSANIIKDNKKYIFISFIDKKNLEFYLVNSNCIFNKEFCESEFRRYKDKLGFDCEIANFIETMKKAIEREGGGDIKISIDKDKMHTVKFILPLASNIKVTSKVLLDTTIDSECPKYTKVLVELLFILEKCKLKSEKNLMNNARINRNIYNNEEAFNNKFSNLFNRPNVVNQDTVKNLKRKCVGSLINPNLKRRAKMKKIVYNKYSNEEEYDEENDLI